MRRLFFLFLAFVLALPLHAEEASTKPQQAILILDASGSMWGKVNGRPKIEIAREVVRDLLKEWNPDLHLGLIAYGHRRRGDCKDIELLIPVGKVDPEAFLAAVNSLTPRGKTPLTDAVLQAAEALKFGEEKATVILVSDGIETCGKDPCKAAEDLKKQGFDFKAHVVGFDLSAEDQKGIRCLADKTGGIFLAANDAASLKSSLETAVRQTVEPTAPTPEPTVAPTPTPKPKPTEANVEFRTLLKEGGEVVDSFYEIESLEDEEAKPIKSSKKTYTLKPGAYLVKAKWNNAHLEQQIDVSQEPNQKIDLIYNAGKLKLSASFTDGGEKSGAYFTLYKPGSNLSAPERLTANSSGTFGVAAGKYLAEAKVGNVSVKKEVEVKPGELTEEAITLEAGKLVLSAKVGDSEEVTDVYYEIFKEGGAMQKKRERITGAAGGTFTLPAGSYIANVRWGNAQGEKTVEIKGGEVTEETLTIEGGILAIKPESASGETGYFSIFLQEGGKLSKKERRITSGSQTEYKLPAGTYRVEGKFGKQIVSAEVVLPVAERVELPLKAAAPEASQ